LAGENPAMPLIYISFPSAKDPAWDAHYPHKATVEIVAPTQPQWFAQWKGSTWGKRGADYEAFKAELTEQLLETLYRHQPQLRGALDFCELGTPLSTEWYQWNEEGEIYGIDHTVQRFEQHWIHSQTPIKGLYLTGADTVTAGVGGALMAGVLTATRMLGWRGYRIGSLLKSWTPGAKAEAGEPTQAL
jgi:all-trans-retinol 13,14-reductase